MRRGFARTLAYVCVLAGLSGAASAQSIRAAALAPSFKNAASTPELRDKFHESVLKGLGSLTGPSGPNGELGEVLGGAETRNKLGDELIGCSGQANCLGRATAALRVNRIIATELTVAGKSYTITMRLYDGNGRELTHADDLCDICTVREAEEAVTKAAARLAAAARSFPLEEAPRPTPTAPVRETKPAPQTPPREEPASPMQPSPTQQPTQATAPEHKHVPWRALAFGSIGLGIVGLAVGIPLVIIDGRPTCDAPDPVHQCKELYNTVGGGGAMLGIGAIALVASIPLFYFDWRSRNRPVSQLRIFGAPAAGGGSLVLGGHF